MTSEGLGEMFEGDSADTCGGKFPLVSMGGQRRVQRAQTRKRGPPSAPAEFIELLPYLKRLGDYCDFVINEGMQKLPTFLRDTKHALQLIEQKNEIGIPENTNFLVADIEQMYPRVPWNFFEWVSRFKKNKTWPTIN